MSLLDKQLEIESFWFSQTKERLEDAFKGIYTVPILSGIKVSLVDTREEFIQFIDSKLKIKGNTKPLYAEECKELMRRGLTIENISDIIIVSTMSQILPNLYVDVNNCSVNRISSMVAKDLGLEFNLSLYTLSLDDKFLARNFDRNIDNVSYRFKGKWFNKFLEDKDYNYLHLDFKALVSLALTMLIFLSKKDIIKIDLQREGAKTQNIIGRSEFLDKFLQRAENFNLMLAYKPKPLIIPPKEYTNDTVGGFYGEMSRLNSFMRMSDLFRKSTSGKNYLRLLRNIDRSKINNVLNTLGKTSYCVNKTILNTVNSLIEKGIKLPCIFELTLEELPTVNNWEALEKKEKSNLLRQRALIHQENTRRSSHYIRFSKTKYEATIYKDYDDIYFPFNIDYRGRIYALSSFLSPQGTDFSKSLLLFSKPKPLTKVDNIKYFYIHGANLAGVDKVSIEDRIKFIKDRQSLWLSIANEPTKFTEWSEMDEPWQFLAWCFEYKKFIDYLSKNNNNPIGFQTGIIIAFDGSCSGLQHFSALLRDTEGAKVTNLIPNEKPKDIYQEVANEVIKALEYDVCNNKPEADLALQWLGFGITRSVTKRPVMTLAYGATKFGFQEQILEDTLIPAIQKGCTLFPDKVKSARYLADKIWIALSSKINSAISGMEYLKEISKVLNKDNQLVVWRTPLGLPICQGYLKVAENSIIKVRVQGIRLETAYINYNNLKLDKNKNKNGISPNFIHSLDASHLMLTVQNCKDKDVVSFSTIHDSFGTELEDCDILFTTVRQSFVQLYTEYEPLELLKESIKLIVDDEDEIDNIAEPVKGQLDLNNVLESSYCFL